MVNFNGKIVLQDSNLFDQQNRGLRYGDALTEIIRVKNGKLIFWEDHYLKLMAAMRVLRMEIPMNFTMEFLEAEILKLLSEQELNSRTILVDIFIFRNSSTQKLLPEVSEVSYLLKGRNLASSSFRIQNGGYEVELFKDFYLSADMLTTINTTNKMLNVVGSVFANENGYQDCLLLNHNKMVVGSLIGNLFLVKDNVVKTAPLTDGALNTVVRDQLIKIIQGTEGYVFQEASISPFELQKADELFIINIESGIIPITKYRKKVYTADTANKIIEKLKGLIQLQSII
ncbi:aminotransferase class IV [Aurantibacter sp.]|uniref:aminotransferase class IV n=1 Tax=Aurantibacter sp. TaxID=2807103 RepID=UPI0032637325